VLNKPTSVPAIVIAAFRRKFRRSWSIPSAIVVLSENHHPATTMISYGM
jgi:hypothetical protein